MFQFPHCSSEQWELVLFFFCYISWCVKLSECNKLFLLFENALDKYWKVTIYLLLIKLKQVYLNIVKKICLPGWSKIFKLLLMVVQIADRRTSRGKINFLHIITIKILKEEWIAELFYGNFTSSTIRCSQINSCPENGQIVAFHVRVFVEFFVSSNMINWCLIILSI